ncbi:MAG TPA: hypothetical protein VF516_25710 [Kofleriaceae bacterium]
MRGFLTVSSRVWFSGLFSGLVLALSLAQGACGGCNDNNSVGHLPDAPPAPDAAPDAIPPDAVSLVVIDHGVPVAGVPVYFLNPDGSVAKATVTGGNGTASAVVTTGGSATAIRPFMTQAPAGKFAPDELRTFLGVKPGDHLVLSRAATDSVTVTIDAVAPDGGDFSTGYQVLTTCGGGVNSISPGGSGDGSGSPNPGGTLELQNCHGAADIAVVASERALARAGGNAIATPQGLYHANATLPPGGNVLVSLRDDTYADLTDVTFTYMNAPGVPITVLHSPVLPNGYLGPYSTTVDTGSTDATISEAAVPATMEVVDSTLQPNNLHEIVDWGPYGPTYALDVGATLLREVTGGPTFDLATGKISWTEATTGATPSLTIAGVLVRRPDPLAKWHWEIVAPYSASGIVLPHLPTTLLDWAPAATDEITLDPLQNVQVTGGYDAVRSHILDIHDETGSTGYVIGNAGRAVIETSVIQPL